MVQNHNIDVLPMAAVGLILVILMVLIAPMVTSHANTAVAVPAAHTSERDVEEDIAVTMTRDSVLYLNDKKIDPKDLMDSLKLTFAEDPYKLLVVRADREVKYLNVLDILTACRLAGAQRMACATVLDTARVYREDTGHAHQ